MPISGLAITVKDETQLDAVCDELRTNTDITIGERHGRKIAIVVETSSQLEDERVRRWIEKISGICHVDITFISFEDDAE